MKQVSPPIEDRDIHRNNQKEKVNATQAFSQSANDIKKAYEHHKIQIMQLKNEIAVLKSSQSIKLDTTTQNEKVRKPSVP